jgi:predicted RNA-binding protein with EMAP domain
MCWFSQIITKGAYIYVYNTKKKKGEIKKQNKKKKKKNKTNNNKKRWINKYSGN